MSTVKTPLADVREAIADGALSRSDIARRTGLGAGTVDAIIDHLERTGALRRETLGSSCPGGSCSGCALASGCSGVQGRGPVALILSRRMAA